MPAYVPLGPPAPPFVAVELPVLSGGFALNEGGGGRAFKTKGNPGLAISRSGQITKVPSSFLLSLKAKYYEWKAIINNYLVSRERILLYFISMIMIVVVS